MRMRIIAIFTTVTIMSACSAPDVEQIGRAAGGALVAIAVSGAL